MNYVVEVVRPTGAPSTLPTHFEIDAPANASAADLRRLADDAIRARWGNSGYYPGEVNFDVYKDDNGNHRGDAAERLGLRPDGTAVPWSTTGVSRFSTDLSSRDGDRPLASVDLPTTVEIPADLRAALRRLSYRSDGQAGPMSPAEKDSFLANLEETIRSNPAWAAHYGTIVGQGNVTFQGVTGTQPVSRLYDERGVDRAGFSSRTTDWWNTRLGNAPAGPNGTNPGDTSSFSGLSSADSTERRARNRRFQQMWEQLMSALARMISGGDITAIRHWMNIHAVVSGLQETDAAMSLIDVTNRIMARKQQINDRMAEIAGMATPTPATSAEMRRLQAEEQMSNGILSVVQNMTEDSSTRRRAAETRAHDMFESAAHHEPAMARWS